MIGFIVVGLLTMLMLVFLYWRVGTEERKNNELLRGVAVGLSATVVVGWFFLAILWAYWLAVS
jgi:hypothetical protein